MQMQFLNRLPRALWLLMPCETWPFTEATVHSYAWNYQPGTENERWYAEISYSFQVEKVLYAGQVSWNSFNEPDAFHRNEFIQVRYNPHDPAISYFPEKTSLLGRRAILAWPLVALLISAIFIYLRQR